MISSNINLNTLLKKILTERKIFSHLLTDERDFKSPIIKPFVNNNDNNHLVA